MMTRESLISIEPNRCVYCGCHGDTKDHLFPKSMLRRISVPNFADNIVYACYSCNQAKGSTVIFPTVRNVHTWFKNLSDALIRRYAQFLVSNENLIRSRLIENYDDTILDSDGRHTWVVKVHELFDAKDFDEVLYLYRRGYYDCVHGIDSEVYYEFNGL